MTPPQPAPKIYPTAWAHYTVMAVGASAVLALVMTAIEVWTAYKAGDRDTVVLFAAGWAVFPPMWFWVEYFYVFRRAGNQSQFEQFKHGQQISAAIWASVTLTLAAMVSSMGPG